MIIKDIKRVSPISIHFTIVDGDREQVRMIFAPLNTSPEAIVDIMADNLNLYYENKAAGFPHDYDTAEHVAGIMADARRYGTD